MNVGPVDSPYAEMIRSDIRMWEDVRTQALKELKDARRVLREFHKELADLAVAERRGKLRDLLVTKYPDGVRVDSDELLADFRALAGLRVGSHDTLRQDLLTMVRDGRVWRKAIAASPKPGRVFVYGPVIAK